MKRKRPPLAVKYYVVRMLLHMARQHPGEIREFSTKEQLLERVPTCQGCQRWMPQEYGGRL
jgi:hypothetical protein